MTVVVPRPWLSGQRLGFECSGSRVRNWPWACGAQKNELSGSSHTHWRGKIAAIQIGMPHRGSAKEQIFYKTFLMKKSLLTGRQKKAPSLKIVGNY